MGTLDLYPQLVPCEDGYILADRFGVPLPDSLVESIHLSGVSYGEYEARHDLAVDAANWAVTPKSAEPEKNRAGYVYAVIVGEKLKIGRTIALQSRFSQYRKTCNNFSVIESLKVEDYYQAESELLAAFGGEPNKHEWFDYRPELLIKVRDVFAEYGRRA